MENLGEGSKAVGGARGVRDDGVGRVVLVEVDTWLSSDVSTPSRAESNEETESLLFYLPQTYMGASAEGAEMMTFLAPPFKWRLALSMVVKTPVDSTT